MSTPNAAPAAAACPPENSVASLEERLLTIAEMLIYGAARQEILDMIQHRWGLSRRTAQTDLQTVQRRLSAETTAADQLFHLRLSQLQRDKLVGAVMQYTLRGKGELDPKIMQGLASLVTAVRGLLDSRDRAALEILQLAAQGIAEAADLTAPPEPEPAEPVEVNEPQPAANGTAQDSKPAPRRSTPPPPASAPAAAPRPRFGRNLHPDHEIESMEPAAADGVLLRAGCASAETGAGAGAGGNECRSRAEGRG